MPRNTHQSKEVAEAVADMGYQAKGKTSPNALVSGELSRLTRIGKIVKNGRNYTIMG